MGISRASYYYKAVEHDEDRDVVILEAILDELRNHPFYGYRKIAYALKDLGVSRKQVRRIMHKAGLRAIYPKRRTSIPAKYHKKYPYLLKGLSIWLPNQVWATDITYIFYDFNFDKNYDAVVSSLALHHLETKEDKLEFYRKIYSCLNDGGIFVNADVVLASTEALQQCYMTQWKNFMLRNVPKDEVDSKWIPAYYEEDRPVSMIEHFEMLKDSGFKIMDVVWKYYNFAVYMAIK